MLECNQKILEIHRPKMLEAYEKIQDTYEQTIESCDQTQSRDGHSVLHVIREGQSARLNSAFRPIQEAERWADQFTFSYLENMVVLFGLGNGLFARALLQTMGKEDALLIYEPSMEILQYTLDHIDIRDLLGDERIIFFADQMNPDEFPFVLESSVHWSNVNALQVKHHPGYEKVFLDEYNQVRAMVKDAKYMVKVAKDTDSFYSKWAVKNTIRSFEFIRESNMFTELMGKFPKELPAIVVAAGPSLDKNIEELKRAQGKAFILATDSSVNILLKHNVSFDAMITVDPGKNKRHISDERCKKIPLFCYMEANRDILEFHTGKKIWTRGARFQESIYREEGHPFEFLNPGNSVANSAFSVCQKIGFTRIVLIGQDLAFDGEVTHAGGEIKHILGDEEERRLIEGIDGGQVRSRYDWIIYRDWFESVIQQLPDVDVIDATEGGALIHGSHVMTLREMIDEYCTLEFDSRGLIDSMLPTFSSIEYESVKEKFMRFEPELQNIKRKAVAASIICSEVLQAAENAGNMTPAYKKVKEVTSANEYIEKQRAYDLLDFYLNTTSMDDLKDINRVTGDEDADLLAVYRSAKITYDALVEAVDALKDIVRDALNKM